MQHGTPLQEIVDAFKDTKAEPNGMVNGEDFSVKMCSSIMDYVVRELEAAYIHKEDAPAESILPVRETPKPSPAEHQPLFVINDAVATPPGVQVFKPNPEIPAVSMTVEGNLGAGEVAELRKDLPKIIEKQVNTLRRSGALRTLTANLNARHRLRCLLRQLRPGITGTSARRVRLRRYAAPVVVTFATRVARQPAVREIRVLGVSVHRLRYRRGPGLL